MASKRERTAAALSAALVALLLGNCSSVPVAHEPEVKQAPAAPVTVTVSSAASPSTTASPSSETSAPATWTDTVAAVGPSVVRLDVLGCDARWMGSGFVVGEHLLMTANHVAEGATAITVQYDGGVTTAEVLGSDPASDSALLRTDAALPGKPLHFLDALPARAQELGVLGFPLQTYELRYSRGTVSGLREPVEIGDHEIKMIVTDSAINGGNSGGPAIDLSGRVVGLVSAKRLWVSGGPDAVPVEGQGYVVPATDLIGDLERWKSAVPMPLESCGGMGGEAISPESSILLKIESNSPLAPDIARSLIVHGEAINRRNFQAAWQVFTPAMQRAMASVDRWSDGLVSSVWSALAIRDVAISGDSATVGAILVTRQDAKYGHKGQTCSVWTMTYTMVNQHGGWLIDKVKALPGSPSAC